MKRMPTAFCISSFRAGGGEKQMIEIANTLVAQGKPIDLLVLKPVGQLKESVDDRIKIVSLDAGRIIFSLPKLVVYLRRERPAVLLSVDEYTHVLSLLARSIARTKTRIILRIGNMLSILAERYEGKAKILPYFSKHLFRKADAIVANSKGVADDIIAITNVQPERVKVVYNPKPLEKIEKMVQEPSGHEWLDKKTIPVVLSVGRLRVQKNFPLIIHAFSKITRFISSRLIIVGSGREEERLKAYIEQLKCTDAISMPGYVDNPYAWMAKADVFISASLWEGLPNSLLEALACGVPVIAADCSSGPREILAPDTDYQKRLKVGEGVEYAKYGILCPVNDEKAVFEALQRLLTDGEMRRSYISRGKERARDFDAQDIVSEYTRILGV